MRAWRGYNKVIKSITEFIGVVKSFVKIIWENLGTPAEVSRPAPENSRMFFNVFFANLLTNMKKPSIICLMIDNILYTLAIGMLYFIVFGGIAVWILNYLLEQIEEIQAQEWSLVEVLVMLVAFFSIGLLVA